jgi:YhcN/YlaJ family sporulation lipoprotein
MGKKFALAITVLLVFSLFAAVGCARAPEQRPAPPPQQTPQPNNDIGRNNVAETQETAQRLSDVAERVTGVRGATVVINERTAMVGLNLDPDLEITETQLVKQRVEDRIRDAEPRMDRVVVTADPDLVAQIERLGKNVVQGRPVSEFTREFSTLLTKITPTQGIEG